MPSDYKVDKTAILVLARDREKNNFKRGNSLSKRSRNEINNWQKVNKFY